MQKFHFIFLLMLCSFISCDFQPHKTQLQENENSSQITDWKEYSFDDAGIKIAFPCEPQKKVLIAEEKPKLIRSFGFKCDYHEITFVVELVEHLSAQDKQKVLDNIELMLKETVGQKNNFEIEDSLYRDKFPMRIFNISNPTTYWRETSIVMNRGVYNIMVFFRKEGQMTSDFNSEFENTFKKFFNSFQIIEK